MSLAARLGELDAACKKLQKLWETGGAWDVQVFIEKRDALGEVLRAAERVVIAADIHPANWEIVRSFAAEKQKAYTTEETRLVLGILARTGKLLVEREKVAE